MKPSRATRRAGLAAASMAIALTAAAGSGHAATPCPQGSDRHQPYGQELHGAHIPSMYFAGGFQIGCAHNPFHVNYGDFAVGQTRVFVAPVGYFDTCDSIQTWAMNGAFQWGPMGQANGGSGNVAQSLKAGQVLAVKYQMVSAYGVATATMSWTANPQCPMW